VKQKFYCVLILLITLSNYLYGDITNNESDPPNKLSASVIELRFLDIPPTIDGNLENDNWEEAFLIDRFYQIYPGYNTEPTYGTKVFLGYDDRYLYMAIEAEDEGNKIKASLTQRDHIKDDDHIQIYIDTHNESRNAYLFMVNPLGVQQDGIYYEDRPDEPDYSFDFEFSSYGEITEGGYTIELAIPLSSLKYSCTDNCEWRIQIIRQISHLNGEKNSWMPLIKESVGFLSQAGIIRGIKEQIEKMSIEVIPEITLSKDWERQNTSGADKLLGNPMLFDKGISIKLKPISYITLETTINPDFAQVESDQFVNTANQRFPMLYEEKRPFFLDGTEIFRSYLNTIHTRTIINPDYAGKVIGKFGDYSLGIILARDNLEVENDLAESISLGKPSYLSEYPVIAMGRFQKSINKKSYIGLISSNYYKEADENYNFGFDGRFALNSNTAFSFQVMGTSTNSNFYEPDKNKHVSRSGMGFGYYLNFTNKSRYTELVLTTEGRTSDYVTKLGYTAQVNINRWSALIRYNADPNPDNLITSWSAVCSFNADFDWQGRMKYLYAYPRILLKLPHQSFINLYGYIDYLRLLEEEFGPKKGSDQQGAFVGSSERQTVYKGFMLEFGTSPLKQISISASVDKSWDVFDYDFGAGVKYPRVSPRALVDPSSPLDPGKADLVNVQSTLIYQAADNFRLSIDYLKSRLYRKDTKKLAYDQNIFRFGAEYNLTRFTFLRTRVELESLESNIRFQLMFGWTPTPGTVLYIGYNSSMYYEQYNVARKLLEKRIITSNQLFFMKLSYKFNMWL